MLFHSLAFMAFFLVVHQIFWRVQAEKRKIFLLISSIFFYGYWSIPFLFHFLFILAVNYFFITSLLKSKNRLLFILSLALNLSNLFIFKYTKSISGYLFDFLGFRWAGFIHDSWHIALPLAISFYTFQIIAYIVDIWRDEIKKTSFVEFSVFIMFFPQLIAGPIMRHSDFFPQLNHETLKKDDMLQGLLLFFLGVLKKVLIADEIAMLVDPVWNDLTHYDSTSIAAAAIGFYGQIYADFSGYTDMGRGIAKMLGYDIPENFYSPFLATSFSDLWKRWHVTLSTWLRDYLYIPLGGNRTGTLKFAINILIVMTLGGIWHGNTYNFFFWGFFHGILLAAERLLGFSKPARNIYTYLPRMILVFLGGCLGVLFFRTPDLTHFKNAFMGILTDSGPARLDNLSHVYELFFGVMLLQIGQEYHKKFIAYIKKYDYILVPASAVILFFWIARIEQKTEQFIYFQF